MRWMAALLIATTGLAGAACSSSDGATRTDPAAATPEPEATAPPVPASWAEIDAASDALARTTTIVAAEVGSDGLLSIVHGREPDSTAAIGSAVGVYVLGIVTDRIAGGDLRWTDVVATGATVEAAATAMMATGDAASTDALVEAVGRAAVEDLMPAMGLGEASQARTLPLRTAREVSSSGGTAATVDTVGWFASATELAKAQQWIDSQLGLPGQHPLDAIVVANSLVAIDVTTWPGVGSTVGSGPGVRTATWLLTRADGRRFVLSVIANDPSGTIDEGAFRSLATGAIDLLATT